MIYVSCKQDKYIVLVKEMPKRKFIATEIKTTRWLMNISFQPIK